MRKTLKPFQKIGARFLAEHPHALLADEPGLGKTLQAIAAVEALRLRRVLVLCPASVRLGWRQEIEECLGASRGWDIVSYNGAASNKLPVTADWDVLIMDEEHFLKTPESQRTQAVLGNSGLVRRATYKWALTGTPILNRPREFYPLLKTLHPGFAKDSFASYAQRYCGAYFDGRGINTRGASRLEELSGRLNGFMLRRTKKEVLPELPPRIISRTPLEVSDADLAAVLEEEALIGNREAKISSVHEDFSALGDMARLLRLTGEAKVPAAVGFIEDLLHTVDKVVVFAHHREVIRRLQDRLKARGYDSVVYHGGMSDTQKRDAVKEFQGKTPVFIGQIQAAGTGINGLQNYCSTVVFAELSWVPGLAGQAVDRVHRIGQTADSVNVHVLHVPGTLESAVLGVFDAKSRVIERLMNDDVLGDLI